MTQQRILIIGGSTRAAADSVRRAGWIPICADLFADLDLQNTAEVIPVQNYPSSLPEDVAHVKADGWFYCGALENHPEIISAMLNRDGYGPLLGSSPAALRCIRDPFWLTATLRSHGFPMLETAPQTLPPQSDGRWMQKPLASAGGRRVCVWDSFAAQSLITEPHYFQRRADGARLSAMFRADDRGVEWLGACRELDPIPESAVPSTLSYCGTCGPLTVGTSAARDSAFLLQPKITAVNQQQLILMARTIVEHAAGLQGLFGLDFRLDGDQIWVTEINPRYTASVEILELASGCSFFNPAVRPHPGFPRVLAASNIVAKRIVYASRKQEVPDLSHLYSNGNPWQVPEFADIPVDGTTIDSGWPICSVLASGATEDEVNSRLVEQIQRVKSLLANQSLHG